MQDPNEDTEWNDVLRAKGILPPKQKELELSEDQFVDMVEEAITKRTGEKVVKNYEDMTLDELEEFEDEEDERVLEDYRCSIKPILFLSSDTDKWPSLKLLNYIITVLCLPIFTTKWPEHYEDGNLKGEKKKK